MKERSILHCDLNNFYASVEIKHRPELKGLPVAVCGDPRQRHGIVLAKSNEAKALGVATAEPIWKALEKCPALVLVSPTPELYQHYSKLARAVYSDYTDLVEPFGIDECWLDVTGSLGLFGPAADIGNTIRKRIKEELGLTISVGVSRNKLLAKMGSDYKKPDALTEIKGDDYKSMLWPLAVRELFGVGRHTEQTLLSMGLTKIGSVALADVKMLEERFGKAGRQLWEYANGIDDSPVVGDSERPEPKSMGNGITLPEDLENDRQVWDTLLRLSDELSARLIASDMRARGVGITAVDNEFHPHSRQTLMEEPTFSAAVIAEKAMELFKNRYHWEKKVRALTVRVYALERGEGVRQLTMFEKDARAERLERLDEGVFGIRERFGTKAISRASRLGEKDAAVIKPFERE